MKAVDQARNALAFLEDAAHQQPFDTLIWGLRERRDAAAREIEEWEELRTLASQIKAAHSANLAHYLELFEARATPNGATVHWARDAQEHNQIVLDILNSRGASRLVKSKSMLTEECELRPFLERRGIQVTETDLGERIQQLDDQPPTHIVGPAFQKTPEDVANVFHRVYGSDHSRLCGPAVGTVGLRGHRRRHHPSGAGCHHVDRGVIATAEQRSSVPMNSARHSRPQSKPFDSNKPRRTGGVAYGAGTGRGHFGRGSSVSGGGRIRSSTVRSGGQVARPRRVTA
ncbi:MAG: L-lactate dehydrogenase complex protein LldF [Mycobacterium sp.]|jgi:hypothetical protein|nr:L-lactate dehydrogenase complex protein LldF [Mycobacterium sp.]